MQNEPENSYTCESTPDYTAPVIIIGAGLTGLITAYHLRRENIPSIILESSYRIGGRVHTLYYPDNATAEAHMEEYWERTPHFALLKELKLPLMLSCPTATSLMIDQEILPHGGVCGPDYFVKIFTEEERKALKEWNHKTWNLYSELYGSFYKGNPLSPNLQGFMNISFAEYVHRSHLPHKVNEWIRITLEAEISIEWDKISALDGIDEMRIFLESPDGFGEESAHVLGGNENYIYALVNKLPKKTIQTECRVTQIEQNDSHVIVSYQNANKIEQQIKGRYAVVTVPLFAINSIKFIPQLNEDCLKAIQTTKFASYIKVLYRLKREAEKLWIQYGEEGLFTLLTDQLIGAIYNSTDFEKQLSKDQDLILTVLIHGDKAVKWSNLPSQEILDKTSEQLNCLFPGFSTYITSSQINAYPQAVAYWPLDQKRSRFDALAQKLREPFGRIQIGGDTTENSHSEGAAIAASRMAQVIINDWQQR